MKALKITFWLSIFSALVAVGISLVTQNDDLVSLSVFQYKTSPLPIWVIIAVSLFLGVFLSTLFFIIEFIIIETKNIRLRRHLSKLERKLKESGESVSALAPLKASDLADEHLKQDSPSEPKI